MYRDSCGHTLNPLVQGTFAVTLLVLLRNPLCAQDTLALSTGTAAADGSSALNLALTGSRPSVIGSTSIYPEATVGPIFASAGAAGTATGKTLSRYGGPGTYTGAISNGSMAVLNRVMAAGLTTTAAGIPNSTELSLAGNGIGLFATGGQRGAGPSCRLSLPSPAPKPFRSTPAVQPAPSP
jgi:hypothetical protein